VSCEWIENSSQFSVLRAQIKESRIQDPEFRRRKEHRIGGVEEKNKKKCKIYLTYCKKRITIMIEAV